MIVESIFLLVHYSRGQLLRSLIKRLPGNLTVGIALGAGINAPDIIPTTSPFLVSMATALSVSLVCQLILALFRRDRNVS